MSEHGFGESFLYIYDPDDQFNLFKVGTIKPRNRFNGGSVGQAELDYLEPGPLHSDNILQDMGVIVFGDVNTLMGHFVDTGEEKLPPPVHVKGGDGEGLG